ncbi:MULTISPECIES: hypothetical protein [unclassified Psychrobacter]|uniref:hypothetical protein n=1 Tax=unclassified Psychrobacter TaxID=196806 RepID=UPI000C34413F|nr:MULTISPECIES: hypothetical protein [unclassified Psychrobacter]MBA6243805.1 hypothetical protein [Psychrobacter sp. Urea-trap-18]MBA6285388.1 hypothetical protein [Psychrobacter sp. Urea-trap-16]MBA6319092.1 hypothetical protein [Psychrobacter sp. Urea-trap-20]MBA6335111.1 hypothetical protein [Psychrobacter sp. Urea-trap-19]PKG59519.1 hypothetical protein CXF63_11270 [Psychrobacter sp. Choline-3u-12]
MDNSKNTAPISTSKSTTTPKLIPVTSQTTFDIGDVVLCPSLSNQPFELTADPYGKRDELTLAYDGNYFYYDAQGFFVKASDDETGDHQPSLYRNTPANQQAINTLYGNATQLSQRKLIDTTSIDDDEVVLLKSSKILNNAGELSGAIDVLDDMSSLLGLIYNSKLSQSDTQSLARLTQTTVDTWAEILNTQLERLNEVLTLTKFIKAGE